MDSVAHGQQEGGPGSGDLATMVDKSTGFGVQWVCP